MFEAILNKSWVKGHDDNLIIGYWAEDGSTYHIECPPQLRDQLIELQNKLHEKLDKIDTLRSQLQDAEMILAKALR